MKKKLRAGILAATGTVGQRLIQLLANHPWFEVSAVRGLRIIPPVRNTHRQHTGCSKPQLPESVAT
jgi:N-acetyl-gamma-glutamylphosphate reductase